MSKKKRVILMLTLILIIIIYLWISGIIPKQIAKICGKNLVKKQFPEMKLECVNVEWSKYHDDYIIIFKDTENNYYSCTINPKYFPINVGQGLNEIKERYQENGKIKEYNTKIAYANYSDDRLIISECLNKDKMIDSSVRHLPIYKISTKEELVEFENKFKKCFTMDQSYGEVPAFKNVTNNYDDEFFSKNTLILAYVSTNSGSFRYGINEVINQSATLCLNISKINNPETYTQDMSGWFLIVEIDKNYIKDCNNYDAQLKQ